MSAFATGCLFLLQGFIVVLLYFIFGRVAEIAASLRIHNIWHAHGAKLKRSEPDDAQLPAGLGCPHGSEIDG